MITEKEFAHLDIPAPTDENIIWAGTFQDGKLVLFMSEPPQESPAFPRYRIIHHLVESYDIDFIGNSVLGENSFNVSRQELVASILLNVTKLYLEAVLDDKNERINNGNDKLH